MIAVLSGLQAGSRGTQACIDAAATIAAIIGDLDTTILFASAGESSFLHMLYHIELRIMSRSQLTVAPQMVQNLLCIFCFLHTSINIKKMKQNKPDFVQISQNDIFFYHHHHNKK